MAPGLFAWRVQPKKSRDRAIASRESQCRSLLSLSSAARTASPLKYWRQWGRWSPPPPAFAACERSSRRRRARSTSSATSSRSSRRRRRRRRRSLRRSEIAPVVCGSLRVPRSGPIGQVRSGMSISRLVSSSGVVCACWASGFPYSPEKDGRLVSSSRL